MTGPAINGGESADELTWLGFALAHVALYRETERLARIERSSREAARMATGVRGRGGVVAW